MKKLSLLVGLVILLSPLVASASFDVSLKYGMKGDAVFELQELLVEQGHLSVSPTGYFGFLTLKAVKQFQLAHDLPSTGYFGILSRGVANTLLDVSLASSTEAEVAETGKVVELIPAPVQNIVVPPTPAPVTAVVDYTPVVTLGTPYCSGGMYPKAVIKANILNQNWIYGEIKAIGYSGSVFTKAFPTAELMLDEEIGTTTVTIQLASEVPKQQDSYRIVPNLTFAQDIFVGDVCPNYEASKVTN